jgi:hypothetical protein
MRFFGARAFAGFLLAVSSSACSNEPLPPREYPAASELMDSKRCATCHPKHYDEWSASMHAYAAEDPVFLAMNQRGQRETRREGETRSELGALCVNCHAPLAVRLGLTDGTDLDRVPPELRGVTCYFCHNTTSVGGTHNNPLELSDDVTMRGRIKDPVENGFHRSGYSALLAGDQPESATMCGSCHDIVLPSPPAPAAVPLERTFTEWQKSVFAPEHAPTPSSASTCTACHLPTVEGGVPIAPEGKNRARHSHHMAGVDGPLTPFPATDDPRRDAKLAAEQAMKREELLDPTVRVEICLQRVAEPVLVDNVVTDPGASAIHVTFDNANAGHNFPSGASQDRRAWAELIAYDGDDVIYQSGVVPEGEPASVATDPDLWLMRDETVDENGKETHMFWTVADHRDKTLPVQLTTNPADADYYRTHLRRRFPFAESSTIRGIPTRITLRLRLMPIGLEVLDDLIASGDLDARFRPLMSSLDLVVFRNDDFHSEPGLVGLRTVTMEYSQASLDSRRFVSREDFTQTPPWKCVGMPRRPRR